MSKLGFTGTQRGMTTWQRETVRKLIKRLGASELHHGDCLGADADCHDLWANDDTVVVHPPHIKTKRAFKSGGQVLPTRSYLTRNHDIVRACDVLVACPSSDEEQLRSGTWATIRFAHKIKRRVIIVYPDGNSEEASDE